MTFFKKFSLISSRYGKEPRRTYNWMLTVKVVCCNYCRIVVVVGEPEQMATDSLNTISNGKAFAI